MAETRLFDQTILRRSVPTSTARTVYVRLGDLFPLACGVGALLLLAAAVRRRTAGRRGRALVPEAGEEGSRRRGDTPPPGGEGELPDRAPQPVAGGAPRTLVVLPTYNERDTIAEVIRGVLCVGPEIDVLVVDDRSPDGTGDLVKAIAAREARVRLRRRPRKMGLASAYLDGFRQGLDEGYDVLVEMDSDLSHRPDDLPRLLAGAERFDLTIGSRYVPGGGVTNWSPWRLRLSMAGNAYARGALRVPLTDVTSGFRAFRRPALQRLLERPITSDGYAFQIELAYRAWREGCSVGEVPITFSEREHGRSKISRRIVVEALWRVGAWGIRDRIHRRPLPAATRT